MPDCPIAVKAVSPCVPAHRVFFRVFKSTHDETFIEVEFEGKKSAWEIWGVWSSFLRDGGDELWRPPINEWGVDLNNPSAESFFAHLFQLHIDRLGIVL